MLIKQIISVATLAIASLASAENFVSTLSLAQAEQLALQDEPGLLSQQWQVQALSERAVADGQLMDPKLQIGMSNLPTDSFDFDQENMTQFKLGVTQQFPAGNTLGLRQEKTQKQSELVVVSMAERKLAIVKAVRLTYLEIYYWEQARQTVLQNKQLFSQLVDIVQSLFSVGKNKQQDLIRVQLELSRLDDRIAKITQKINAQRAKLARWITSGYAYQKLATDLPELGLTDFKSDFESDFEMLGEQLIQHPKIQEMDRKLEIARKEIELAREQYKPDWALNVSYGYRDNHPDGMHRADFISAGITMDLPLFTANRQDKKILFREHEYQSLKDKRIDLLRQLVSQLQQQLAIQEQLLKRQKLYSKLLLPQAKQQTQASLLAYQSDQGDFADVMRAFIDDLNANLDARRIAIDLLQAQAKIRYFMTDNTVFTGNRSAL